ncbi:MAG: hypothetical protein RIM23_11140 [Coleofasciculus sp. G3-WIS-01]|uniref:HEAT repeat domain-containing protein n=1 Tax=Coleofasciculus sp. G3-WIS-01 TaxID=3069528 RepID=UPI0032F8C2C9
MLKAIHKTKPFSHFFLFLFTLFLTLQLALPWVSAEEPPKPQPWQIDGIIAALDDGHDQVKGYALGRLARYESQDLQAVLDKPGDIAQKAANILRDKTLDSYIRNSAAGALGNLGEAGAPYIPDIINFIQDETLDAYLPRLAINALVNLGKADAQYIPDIINFIQDETIDFYQSSYIRSSAAYALGNLGESRRPLHPGYYQFSSG